jgi:hypothetical protein
MRRDSDNDNDEPVWPTPAVGALFRSVRLFTTILYEDMKTYGLTKIRLTPRTSLSWHTSRRIGESSLMDTGTYTYSHQSGHDTFSHKPGHETYSHQL